MGKGEAHGQREKACKTYPLTAKTLYRLVAVLPHYRVPFEYIPKKKCGMKNYPTMRKTSQIEFELPLDCPFTIANILYEMQEKYGDTFDFTIIQEIEY